MLTYFNFVPGKECDLYNKQHNVHKKYRSPKICHKEQSRWDYFFNSMS